MDTISTNNFKVFGQLIGGEYVPRLNEMNSQFPNSEHVLIITVIVTFRNN